MSDKATAALISILTTQTTAIIVLAFVLVKTREEVIALRERLDAIMRRSARRRTEADR